MSYDSEQKQGLFDKQVAEALGWTGLHHQPDKTFRNEWELNAPIITTPGEWVGHSPENTWMETPVHPFSQNLEYSMLVWRQLLELDSTACIGKDYIGLEWDESGPQYVIRFDLSYISNLAKAICEAFLITKQYQASGSS